MSDSLWRTLVNTRLLGTSATSKQQEDFDGGQGGGDIHNMTLGECWDKMDLVKWDGVDLIDEL